MGQTMPRAEREAAFAQSAQQMHQALEDWYDEHPAASFGEIEQEARRLRRILMGETLSASNEVMPDAHR